MVLRFLHICFFTLFSISLLFSQDEKGYEGYRIYMSSPEIVSSKKKGFKIKFKGTNTGSKALAKDSKSEYQDKLIIKLDESLRNTNVDQFRDLIENKIAASKFNLKAGQSGSFEYKIKIPKERRGIESFSVNTGGGSGNGFNRKLCPDLVLDSLIMLKRDKKHVYVEFIVSNIGKGAINIIGDKKDDGDNVNVGAYFAGSPKFSRGAIPADQMYLEGLEETQGILFPEQSMKVSMKVSRKHQTKYNKTLIIFVDSNKIVIECNETNNRGHVLVK